MYRNYNLGRIVDSKTKEFETELETLCNKYKVFIETESFDGEETVLAQCSYCETMNEVNSSEYLGICSGCKRPIVFCDSCTNRDAQTCAVCSNGSKHSLRNIDN